MYVFSKLDKVKLTKDQDWGEEAYKIMETGVNDKGSKKDFNCTQ